MNQDRPPIDPLKYVAYICVAAMSLLFIGGIVFYKERTLFADSAFVLFKILNEGKLAIQCERYGAFITQLVAYTGQKLHLPIKVILISYSAGFGLFYLIVNSLIAFRYRQYALAIFMSLFYFLFVSDSYYWGSEIPQGICWMFLMFGITIYMGQKQRSIALILIPFAVFGFLTVFTHFSIMIATVFLCVYLILEKKNWPFSSRNTILLSAVLGGLIITKFTLACAPSQAAGEAPILYNVTHVSLNDIYLGLNKPVISSFFGRFITNYWMGTIVFVLGIYSLIRSKKKMLLAWYLLSCFGYIVIMGLAFGGLDANVLLFHIESEWLCISVIVAAPFALEFLPNVKLKLALPLMIVLFVVRLAYIGHGYATFHWHTQFQERVFSQMKRRGINKLALYRDWDTKAEYMLDWASPYESLLASSMRGDKPQLCFTFINDNDNTELKGLTPNTFNTGFGYIHSLWLNPQYFSMDTVTPYQAMYCKDLFKN